MSTSKVILKDKYPQRSCKKCLNYPCIEDMDKLKSNFAKLGCDNWLDSNVFNLSRKKKSLNG